jgi:hypothetical protein
VGNAAAADGRARARAPENLREDLLGAPRAEAEPVRASAVRRRGGRGRAGLEAVLAVLVIDGALLRVAEHLPRESR